MVYPNGRKEWSSGEDLKRAEWQDGTVEDYDGEGRLKFILYANGDYEYFSNGRKHRGDGKPALLVQDVVEEYWEEGHLHREDGPAISHADGRNLYFLRGVQISRTLHERIASKKISFDEFMKETNLEIRRVIIEAMGGYSWLLLAGKAKLIEETERGKLLRIADKEEDIVLLVLKDSTTELPYVLCMPPNTKSVMRALEWSFELPPGGYHPANET
jgi:hypothetical protein